MRMIYKLSFDVWAFKGVQLRVVRIECVAPVILLLGVYSLTPVWGWSTRRVNFSSADRDQYDLKKWRQSCKLPQRKWKYNAYVLIWIENFIIIN